MEMLTPYCSPVLASLFLTLTSSCQGGIVVKCWSKLRRHFSSEFAQTLAGRRRLYTHVLYLRYLDNEAATRAAFDSDGYYRTGDQCYVENGIYFIEGRTSHDCKCSSSLLLYSRMIITSAPNPKTVLQTLTMTT